MFIFRKTLPLWFLCMAMCFHIFKQHKWMINSNKLIREFQHSFMVIPAQPSFYCYTSVAVYAHLLDSVLILLNKNWVKHRSLRSQIFKKCFQGGWNDCICVVSLRSVRVEMLTNAWNSGSPMNWFQQSLTLHESKSCVQKVAKNLSQLNKWTHTLNWTHECLNKTL